MEIVIGLLVFLVLVVFIVQKNKEPDIAKEYSARNAVNEEKNRRIYYLRYDTDKYTQPTEAITTTVAGISFENRLGICGSCVKGEELMLAREPDNEHEPNAVMVVRFTGEVLGYLTRDDAAIYAPLIDDRVLIKTYFGTLSYFDRWFDAYIELIEYKPNETTTNEKTNE